jgi:hypothetical protein
MVNVLEWALEVVCAVNSGIGSNTPCFSLNTVSEFVSLVRLNEKVVLE